MQVLTLIFFLSITDGRSQKQMWNITMVVSYVVIDKQCAWQQDRSPEGSDGPQNKKNTLRSYLSFRIMVGSSYNGSDQDMYSYTSRSSQRKCRWVEKVLIGTHTYFDDQQVAFIQCYNGHVIRARCVAYYPWHMRRSIRSFQQGRSHLLINVS